MPTSRSRSTVEAFWLGRVPHQQTWELQRELVAEVEVGRRPDTLLLLEHPHTFTLGRRGVPGHVLWDQSERDRRGVEVVHCDRGGEATYHGPGQLVGYPILDLRRHGRDVHAYVRRLERSLIEYLAALGLEAGPLPGQTGVWSAGPPGAGAAGRPQAEVAAIGA